MPTNNAWNTPDLTTNGQILIGKTGNRPVAGNLTSTAQTLVVTNGAGTVDVATQVVLQTDTGWGTWGGAGNYFDDTTLGSFTILRPGTGFINGIPVSWTAPQTVTGMTAGNTYYIYIDNTGTIGKTTPRSDALFINNIVLFECLRDSTSPTNNQITVKENHPYNYPVNSSNYEHDNIGTLIESNTNGANITLNGTQKIQINGADVLSDHGLETTIPDSGGVGVTWHKVYTNASGKWAVQNINDTFAGFYNNAGTPTALAANRFGVYTLYVSKDNLTSSTPTYYAVLDVTQYANLTAANTAIANGTVARSSNELAALELCQLGFIVFSQAANAIVNVVISKTTLRASTTTSGTNTAALVTTNTSNFNHALSSADTNVQAALDTLDDVVFKWFEVTADTSAVVNSGYIANKAGTECIITLPATAIVGSTIKVCGKGATGWRLAQGAGQQIFFGNKSTTSGAGGYLEFTQQYDAISLVCPIANTTYTVIDSIGNITVV